MIKAKESMRRQFPKLGHSALIILVILLCLIGGTLVLRRQEVGDLRQEIKYMEGLILQNPVKETASDPWQMDDLLLVMDECVRMLREENLAVRSYHLEGVFEGEANPSFLHFALIRLKVQGAWSGIERGLTRIEGISEGGIYVEEAVLKENEGEILLKIFFFEPDNLS
ncbi:hypothetical protein [Desulfitobacterium chlororespirans]|uniref:Uncharacterized protein n=1 Tax=Desulfitobacterium chlororespirans DSM 11544 TaxID=1121395 RepID=A0A1M7U6P6_9FIRM|nr:hypothetical protein [Desulfitobacterium chlororespirans]SHN78604.1 hypothetical protein SAMN02745215_03089 [Desulfitobacterium chlororespirans DSM 11544]